MQVMRTIVQLAVDEVNKNQLIPNFNLSVLFRYSNSSSSLLFDDLIFLYRDSMADERVATEAAYDLLQNETVLGLIGERYSFVSIAIQRIASIFQVVRCFPCPCTADISKGASNFKLCYCR